MLLREVEYARAASVDEAVRLLAADEGARALAGGQSLLNVMKARAAAPDVLVDLNDLGELREIRAGDDGSLEIGAMATYSQLLASSEVWSARPVLAEVAGTIADVQVRNRGTIGGNVCFNDPTNHFPPLLVALDARFTIVGRDGERTVGADEFFVGVFMTVVGPGELLTRITIPGGSGVGSTEPPGSAGAGSAGAGAGKSRDGFAAVTIGKDGTCMANAAASLDGAGGPRVVLGCVDSVPRLFASADEVEGAQLDPPSDVHASADYRRHLATVCARRAVAQAQGRSQQ